MSPETEPDSKIIVEVKDAENARINAVERKLDDLRANGYNVIEMYHDCYRMATIIKAEKACPN